MLEQLRTLDGETGAAVSAYLDLVGYRLLDGFDISGRYALEMPDALLRAIRVAVDEGARGGSRTSRHGSPRSAARCPRSIAPSSTSCSRRPGCTYRIRDERGVFSDIWASGIMRRAALAGGRRLAAKGRIHDAEHFVDAGFDEMQRAVSGTGGPSADELAERHAYRTSHTAQGRPGDARPAASASAGPVRAAARRPRG